MGAIKDLVDLVTDLSSRVSDRKFAEELRNVQGMIGAIQSEHAEIHEQRISLMTENAELKQQNAELRQQIVDLQTQESTGGYSSVALNEKEIEILLYLSNHSNSTVGAISHAISENETKTEFWLDRMCDLELLQFTLNMYEPSEYFLLQAGRGYLVEKSLI